MTLQERIVLNEFVDRTDELEGFCKILEGNDHLIMMVCGTDGIGKTSLLIRLGDECSRRSRRLIKVSDEGIGDYDYLMVMRQVIDAVGDQYFRPLIDLINYFTVPDYEPKIIVELKGSIAVANSAQFINSTVGEIVGIKDLHLPPRPDMRVPEAERIIRLSKQFFADLSVALGEMNPQLGNKPIIIFVDDVEKMTEGTRTWVWTRFLRSVLDDILKNVNFVLGIHDAPQFDRFMQTITQTAKLRPFDEQHVTEYIKKRLKNPDQGLINMVNSVSKGVPMTVATMIDGYLVDYPDQRAL